MYSLSRGPTKFTTTTRNVRGIQKQRDNFDLFESSGKRRHDGFVNSPKPTFNGSKQKVNNNTRSGYTAEQNEFESQQHEEIVKYFSESWSKICKECEMSKKKDQEGGPLWYKEKTPNPKLSDFKPLDLHEWWRERFLEKLNESG